MSGLSQSDLISRIESWMRRLFERDRAARRRFPPKEVGNRQEDLDIMFNYVHEYFQDFGHAWVQPGSPTITDFDGLLLEAISRAHVWYDVFDGERANELFDWLCVIARPIWAESFRAGVATESPAPTDEANSRSRLKRQIEDDLLRINCLLWDMRRELSEEGHSLEGQLFKNTFIYLQRFGYSWLRKSSPRIKDFDDLLGETMCQAMEKFPRFKGRTANEFLAWVFSLSRSIWAKDCRDERRRKDAQAVAATRIASSDFTPHGRMEIEDRNALVNKAISLMDEKYRIPIETRYVHEEYSWDMWSKIGLTEGAAKTRLRRGRLELRSILGRLGYGRELLLG